MKHLLAISLISMAAIFMEGCGPKVYTKGTYDDPNRVELLDDKFNEADMQQMANQMIQAISTCPEITEAKTRPTVAVSKVVNRTEEHTDLLEALNEYIRTESTKVRKVKFIDRQAREELEKEYAYSDTGKVSRETLKKAGKQLGVDYLLNGALTTNIQEVDNDKFVYYILTMNLVNVDTSAIDCSEKVELRKKFRKRSTGLF